MPHRNRVLPSGEIVADPHRGDWMGNRGGATSGRRQWASKHWIYCLLSFKERQRVFRDPGRKYTELFFFDEAVALAAGHRPCGECQHRRLIEYKAATLDASVTVEVLDSILHRERLNPEDAEIGGLPDGTFVEHGGRAVLLWRGAAHPWTPEHGYDEPLEVGRATRVRVLTPDLTRRALAAGFTVRPRLEQGPA